MSDHSHHDHHAQENKPVAFVTPLILGLVTALVILLFVSIGDPKQHGHACCEGQEQCEHHEGSHHGAEATEGASHHESAGHEAHEAKAKEAAAPQQEEVAAPAAAEPAHEEAHH